MIIWGSKGREKELATGRFDCPQCATRRPYRHVRVAKWFTLYFIPVFPMETLGEFVECGVCKTTFKPAVLTFRLPTEEERMLGAVRAELESGTPLQMARRKLVNAGMDEAAADRLVEGATAGQTETCAGCGLTFVQGIPSCTGCGQPLGAVPAS